MKKLFFGMTCIVLALSQCQYNRYQEGERLYGIHCANCHGENGEGLAALIPPLAGADYLQQYRPELACILVKGLSDTIVVNGKSYFGQPMPANATLSDIQVTNILNFIGHQWGNQLDDFKLDEVRKQLSTCQ